jgi:hypothetical protein
MRKFFTDLNITQRIFLFLFLLNQPLYYLYIELWLGQLKTRIGSSRIEIQGKIYPNYNEGTVEEIFLWIGVSIILLIGVFLFKSKNE